MPLDCLLYAGHAGVELDSQPTVIWGFNPRTGTSPLWQVMQDLVNGNSYPGIVTDDSNVFEEAKRKRFSVLTFDVVLPDPAFQLFESTLAAERKRSQYSYGFPNGDGDCNCVTWLERLALPITSGSVFEFVRMTVSSQYASRRFGQCV
jgi:hypothetical protein